MSQENWTKLWKFVAAVALALSALATTLAGIAIWTPVEEAVPRAYQCDVYTEQGCAKFVVASGGELEIQSGGVIELQAGSLMTVAAATDMTTTLNVDGAVTFNSTLDVDGNISSGTGGISVTDTISVSGAANFDSAAVFQSTVDIVGNLSSSTGGISVTDTISVEGAVNFDSTLAVGDDITFVNGTTLGEATDTVLDFSEFLAATEQTPEVVTEQSTIVPTGTYQPITSGSALSTSLTTAIQDGTVNGQLLILVNENGADAITIVDGANTKMGGDKVLTGGQGDSIFLIWDGADWLCIGYNDN